MSNPPYEIYNNATIITCDNNVDALYEHAIVIANGEIVWLGAMASLPKAMQDAANEIHDVQGRLITPGFIDCHTHLIYAGNRSNEFAMRLQGASYAEIAQSGGGIHATVAATRAASMEELYEGALARIEAIMQYGVTAVEIKSGYGLDFVTEKKMLMVAKQLQENVPITICKTFLGAHTIPKEYQGKADAYIDLICEQMIPALVKENLIDAVDIFCETIAFNLQQAERIFKCAQQYQLKIKCHAEQLSSMHAATLAANYHALSVDHLEFATIEDVKAMQQANSVAVILPGAYYYLREQQKPPIDLLRAHKVPMALATDCNPGTSPIFSLPMIMNMACLLFGLTPEEALLGVTQHAARALGLASQGTLTVGKRANLAIWETDNYLDLIYYQGVQMLNGIIV